ncbi:MAG: hypothetical protein EOO01_35585, partial [Chitinophagaceae bacterium]
MQGNNFDDSIRDLLNSHSPEFNPADWARMEQMLQHVPAPGASESPVAGSSASGSAAGSAVAGMKLWAAAALITLTATTAVIIYDAISLEKETEQAVSTGNKAIGTENLVVLTENPANDVSENSLANPQGSEQERSSHISPVSVAKGKVLTVQDKKEIVSTGIQKVKGADITNTSSADNSLGGSENMPSGGKSAYSFQNPSAGAGNFGSGNTRPESGYNFNGVAANPCQSKSLPTLPFVVAGLDTVKNLEFTLYP